MPHVVLVLTDVLVSIIRRKGAKTIIKISRRWAGRKGCSNKARINFTD